MGLILKHQKSHFSMRSGVSELANTCYGARNGARKQCGVSNLVKCCEQTKHYGLEQRDFGTLKIILSHQLEIE